MCARGGEGDDTMTVTGTYVVVAGGAGDDNITANGTLMTVNAGAGDDFLRISGGMTVSGGEGGHHRRQRHDQRLGAAGRRRYRDRPEPSSLGGDIRPCAERRLSGQRRGRIRLCHGRQRRRWHGRRRHLAGHGL